MLPFKALIVFETVTRNKSFTKAAEELNVTQSAISHHIKNLEGYFGLKLLERNGSYITLTPSGESLYMDVSQSISILRRGIANLKAKASMAPIGVSVRSHFALKWLSPHLSKANFDYDFRFYHSNEPADFSNADIQVSIEWLHKSKAPASAKLLVNGKLTPGCHPDMIEGWERPYNPALLKEFVLLHETDATAWDEWLVAAGVTNLTPSKNEYYSDTNVRQEAAMEKLGFALVCPELIKDDIKAGRMICPFDISLESYAYYLIVPEDRMNSSKVRNFVYWLLDEI